MSKSAIYTLNTASQATVAAGTTISVGGIVRRFGCNCDISGNGIVIRGTGYYEVEATVTVAPTAAGTVTVQLYKDGAAVTGASATATTSAATQSVTLPVIAMIRETCCCDSTSVLTFGVSGADATVSLISAIVDKI